MSEVHKGFRGSLGFQCRKLSSCAVPALGSGSLSSAALVSTLDGEGSSIACPGVANGKEQDLDKLERYDRMLIELCTNKDSKMEEETVVSVGCLVVTTTIEEDLTTPEGLLVALNAQELVPDKVL